MILAVVMLTLPLFMALHSATENARPATQRGDQPGGLIRGRVLDHLGQPLASHRVQLLVMAPGVKGQQEVETDLAGAFVFEAPPASNAIYRLQAGGGIWIRSVRELGFLTAAGEAIPGGLEQDLQLTLGAVLVIELEGQNRKPVGHADVHIRGEWQEKGLFRFAPRTLEQSHSLEGSPLRLEGLPPMKGRVTITLDGGRVISFDIQLPEGETFRRIRL